MMSFLPALLAKLTLILALGLIVSATLRSSSPSLRHLVLLATLASGLALPVVMLISPKWNVPLLTSASSVDWRDNNATSLTTPVIRHSVPSADPQSLSAARPSSNASDVLAELPIFPLLWAIGFAGILAWLAIGRVRLDRIAATSWPLGDSDWSRILEQERKYAGVGKPVLLFSSSVVSTPLTWGWRSPVVLLPEDAVDWPEQHRRIVLRHELAHVARGDSLAQLLAGFACALYWFHPLVWVAERRLRSECERACDDTVVSLGTPAAEYAAHLLEVARSARAFGAPGFLSVAMARPSQLEGRLLAVLSESRQRISLSRGARRATVALSALVLVPLAAFRAVPKPDRPVNAKSDQRALPDVAPSAASRLSAAVRTNGLVTNSAAASASIAAARTSSHSDNFSGSYLQTRVADSVFQLSAPVKSGGTLNLDLKTGGEVTIKGWDRSEVSVHASLGGRNWRETQVTLRGSDGDATLVSNFTQTSTSHSTSHHFDIQVPRNFDVRIRSSGGSISIADVNGVFTGQTGGGEITIRNSNGEVDIRTGGGEIHVSDSNLNGSVSTGGGPVRIIGVNGNLSGQSGSGPVIYTNSGGQNIGTGISIGKNGGVSVRSGSTSISSSGRSTSISNDSLGIIHLNDGSGRGSGFAMSGIRMTTAGGPLSLASAPNGARVTTGGGPIRIGPSGGEVYAQTGGGRIDIGPAQGSVEAHTGAGDVTIELEGANTHSVDVTSGKGEVVLILPRDINATLELESAYTNNLGHKTRIESDWALTPTETSDWDASEGTPRRYVRVRQNLGRGGAVIRVRTVNGNIVLKRER